MENKDKNLHLQEISPSEEKVQGRSLPIRLKRNKQKPEGPIEHTQIKKRRVDFLNLTVLTDDKRFDGIDYVSFRKVAEIEKELSGKNTGRLDIDSPIIFQILNALDSEAIKRAGYALKMEGLMKSESIIRLHLLPYLYEMDAIPISTKTFSIESWKNYGEIKSVPIFRESARVINFLGTAGQVPINWYKTTTKRSERDSEEYKKALRYPSDIYEQIKNHPYKKLLKEFKRGVARIFSKWDYVTEVITRCTDSNVDPLLRNIDPKVKLSRVPFQSCLAQSLTGNRPSQEDFDEALRTVTKLKSSLPTSLHDLSYGYLRFNPESEDEASIEVAKVFLTKGAYGIKELAGKSPQFPSPIVSWEEVRNLTKWRSTTRNTVGQCIYKYFSLLKESKTTRFTSLSEIGVSPSLENSLSDAKSMIVPTINDMWIISSYLALKTGWNKETIAVMSVDIDKHIEYTNNPELPDQVKISAYKARSKRDQWIIDRLPKEKNQHKINYVGSVLTRVKDYLVFLDNHFSGIDIDKPGRNLLDHVGFYNNNWFSLSRASQTEDGIKGRHSNASHLINKFETTKFTFSAARKLFAEYTALESNFDIRLIQSKLGHRNPIMRYISSVVIKAHSQLRLSEFQEVITSRLKRGLQVDTVLLKNHYINGEQDKWKAIESTILKNRANSGYYCTTNYKIMRPDSEQLMDCSTGRCALCKNACVSTDSWEGLAKRLAEIAFLTISNEEGLRALNANNIFDEQDRIISNLFHFFKEKELDIARTMKEHYHIIEKKAINNKDYRNSLLIGMSL